MKILIMSDCHSNIDALNAVWEKEQDCDAVLFAGDMVDWGLYPVETVHWFMERKNILHAVRGNHDEYIINGFDYYKNTGRPAQNCAELTWQLLGNEEMSFLRSIGHETTFTLDGTDFYMCHTPDELTADDIFYVERQLSEMKLRSFFTERFSAKFPDSHSAKRSIIYGHTHMQWVMSAGEDESVINPGSLSYRFGSSEPVRCADYIVLENGSYSLRHASFDTSKLYKKAESYDFDSNTVNTLHGFYR